MSVASFRYRKTHSKEINKILMTFLWSYKNPKLIARETLFLPRERRSQNIASIHRKSRTENKIFITTWKRKQHWVAWVVSKINNFTPKWTFLKQNTSPKNYDQYIPKFYDDIIKLTNINEIKKKETTTKNIYIAIVN